LESNIAFDPSGKYLALAGYIANSSQQKAAIQIFELNPDGKFVALGSPVVIPAAQQFEQINWDNYGHLYALPLCSQQVCETPGSAGALYIFKVSETGITSAPGSPHVVPNAQNLAVMPPK
jgi:hypothetical protein